MLRICAYTDILPPEGSSSNTSLRTLPPTPLLQNENFPPIASVLVCVRKAEVWALNVLGPRRGKEKDLTRLHEEHMVGSYIFPASRVDRK